MVQWVKVLAIKLYQSEFDSQDPHSGGKLSSDLCTHAEPGIVVHAFNPSPQEAEAGVSLSDQSQPALCSEFQSSWGYRENLSQKSIFKWKENSMYCRSTLRKMLLILLKYKGLFSQVWWWYTLLISVPGGQGQVGSRQSWFTQHDPGQPGLQSETLPQKSDCL